MLLSIFSPQSPLSARYASRLPLLWLLFSLNLAVAQDINQEQQQSADDEANNARLLALASELEQRQLAIDNMQSDLGIYAPALLEAYSDLATLYNELEDYSSAIKSYTDALQLARINSGLFSEPQLPVIQSLIVNNGKLEEWQEVDDLQQLKYFVSSRIYALDDFDYITAVERYGAWKLRLLRENLLDQNYRGLSNTAIDLSDFYDRVITKIETQTNSRPEKLLPMIYGKTQADMALARSIASTPYNAFEGTVSPYVSQTRCQNVRTAQGQYVRQCYQVKVVNPRYRQSQRDAKQFALNRYTREITKSIEKLRDIKNRSTDLSRVERQQLDGQIAQLETESGQLMRAARRQSLF